MAREINNSEDIIDSRDVIARIDELESDISGWEEDIGDHRIEIEDKESEIEDLESEIEELNKGDHDDVVEMIAERENNIAALRSDISDIEENITTIGYDIEEAQEELSPLKSLAEEAEGYSADWNYGQALIRDSYFEEYAQQLAEDIGAIHRPAWPCDHIDWEAAADALKMDYTQIDFDGVDYWIR